MKRALLILLAILVVVPLAALAVAHFTLNQDALRARIEAAVQKATGRELTIAGPIRVGWSLTPAIEADDLSLANPPGFSRPAMAHVDRIEAKVSLLPLLSHRLEVTGLTIAGPNVLLERNAQGRPNWEFSKAAPTAAPSTAPTEPGQKLTLDVGAVALTNATFAFQGAQRLEVAAPRLTFDPNSGHLDGDIAFRGAALHVTGVAAPLDLHLQGEGLTLAISGAYPNLTLSGEAANLASLSALAGANLPPLRDVRLATKATIAPASLAFDGLTLSSAQGDLSGNLMIGRTSRPTLRGALRSTRFDLDALALPPASAPAPSAPPQPPPQPPRQPPATPTPAMPTLAKLIPDTPIPFAALRQADADLQIDAAALVWRGKTYPHLTAHLVLQDGKLDLDPTTMAIGDKTLSAQIQADATAQTVGAKIEAPGVPAGPLLALFDASAHASGRVDLSADLHGQGATWRAVAASLDGNAGLAMVDGDIDNAGLLDALQDTLRAANLPIPTGGGSSKVRCAAIRADAQGGKVRLTALTLDTTKLKLDGTGEIDLGTETLDLHLHPTLRLGAALSVPIHVSGTLRAPKVVLDSGALAPGRVGISIGGPAPPDTCGPALTLARGGQAGPMPTTPEPGNRTLKPADILRGLLR